MFKIGDKIVCVKPGPAVLDGTVFVVTKADTRGFMRKVIKTGAHAQTYLVGTEFWTDHDKGKTFKLFWTVERALKIIENGNTV